MQQVHFFASGRVQGVWYRASTEIEAQRLGLVGWVRNLPDGRVEALAEGPADALRALVAWAHHGPPHAQVARVESAWSEATGAFTAFEVR